jgi:hypothetical protein
MRSLILTAAGAALLFTGAAAASAQTNDGRDRWVNINNLSQSATVVSLHAVPSDARASVISGPDLIPSVTIGPGRTYRVNFDNGRGTCLYDIRALSQIQGAEWTVRNFNVCTQSNLNLGS